MTLSRVTREDVLEALRLLEAGHKHNFGAPRKYRLVHGSSSYAPKAALGVAAEVATGRRFGPADFSAGERHANIQLRKLGFEIRAVNGGANGLRSWLLLTLPADQRQHAGNVGYEDDVEHVYRYDSLVPNWKAIQAGDIAVLRSDECLGVARIARLESGPGRKLQLRCPRCNKTTIKRRQRMQPPGMCQQE